LEMHAHGHVKERLQAAGRAATPVTLWHADRATSDGMHPKSCVLCTPSPVNTLVERRSSSRVGANPESGGSGPDRRQLRMSSTRSFKDWGQLAGRGPAAQPMAGIAWEGA
jgi:hypothetical protein